MKKCPFLKKACIADQCMLWQERMGMLRGEQSVRKDCAFNFAVDMMLEGAQNAYGTARAVEIFREDMKKQNDGMATLLASSTLGISAGQLNRLANDKS